MVSSDLHMHTMAHMHQLHLPHKNKFKFFFKENKTHSQKEAHVITKENMDIY